MTPELHSAFSEAANSPNVNTVSCAVRETVQDRVHKNQIQDVEELRQRVKEEWNGLDQRVTNTAIVSE